MNKKFYVLTGGPGAGKTTTLGELRNRGHKCIDESGRKIIQQQVRSGQNALPWANKQDFIDLMIEDSIKNYQSACDTTEPVFFDRGLPDILGYAKLEDIPIESGLAQLIKIYRYQTCVFIFPPWQEIYQNDAERKQTFEVAVSTYHAIAKAYSDKGYKLIRVPPAPVTTRCEWILNTISKHQDL